MNKDVGELGKIVGEKLAGILLGGIM